MKKNSALSHSTHPDRDLGLDILKGLGIFLVVYGHIARGVIESAPAGNLLSKLDFLIYTTHMPLFFLIAGFHACKSLEKATNHSYLVSRVWAIIYPYLVWSAILWSLKYATSFLMTINNPLQLSDLFAILWQPISVFWFLYALLVMQLLALSFKRIPEVLLLGMLPLYLIRGSLPNNIPNHHEPNYQSPAIFPRRIPDCQISPTSHADTSCQVWFIHPAIMRLLYGLSGTGT